MIKNTLLAAAALATLVTGTIAAAPKADAGINITISGAAAMAMAMDRAGAATDMGMATGRETTGAVTPGTIPVTLTGPIVPVAAGK